MQTYSLRTKIVLRCIALAVAAFGLLIIAASLVRQLHLHPGQHRLEHLNQLVVAVPLVVGLTLIYLGSLLLRQKYNAWVAAVLVFAALAVTNAVRLFEPHPAGRMSEQFWWRVLTPLTILASLLVERRAFRVRSDVRSLQRSIRFSLVVLTVTLLYGVGGFILLDKRDFRQEISLPSAIHQTIDQFGLTTDDLTPYTRRAKFFQDSLSTISVLTGLYIAISLFQPLRLRLSDQSDNRARAEALLEKFPSDIDDFFKLWPHDKLYYFDASGTAGIAYHVSRGQALVAGDPFGDPKRFADLLTAFGELCFVNDWQPAFMHVPNRHRALYEQFDFRLQKIGEEAVLDLAAFQESTAGDKYFRHIRNRFSKLDYRVELLQPPHSRQLLHALQTISNDWLRRPGREERGFMLGHHTDDYLQRGPVAVALDVQNQVQGFINLVPTFTPNTANYDLLRCSSDAPGNCNDFLLLGLIVALQAAGIEKLNLGLTPLAGLQDTTDETTLIHNALRFVYANGDRFYSFSGLRRFKEKYKPEWESRYIAYRGGAASFTRSLAALNRAMRVKHK